MIWSAPPAVLIALWLLWTGQALWCWYNAAVFRGRIDRWDRRQRRRQQRNAAYHPPAAVIVAVKGAGAGFQDHLHALRRQAYPDYRLIFAVESEDDPAYAALAEHLGPTGADHGCRRVDRVVAGLADRGSQKVHNLAAALRTLEPTDEAVAFADADAMPDSAWLERLVHPLRQPAVGAVTGYRWLVPEPTEAGTTLASHLASVINGSVATLLGPWWRSRAWGGSVALRRETIEQTRLLDWWDGALSDDYQMTRALRAAGLRTIFVPRLLVRSPASFTGRSLRRFARRQYLITRVYAPGIWAIGLAATSYYCLGWLTALAALLGGLSGWGWALAAAALVYAADLGRARQRRRALAATFDEPTMERLRPALRLDAWATPLWMALHALLIASSAVGRRIRWAGVTYELRGPQRVRIVEREGAG